MFAVSKEIMEQAKATEAAATAGWKRMEEETEAHKQGINSMFKRITTIQSYFRTAIRRDDVLEKGLGDIGAAIDSTTTKTDATNGLIYGAASEIGWLKARIDAMEN